MTQLTTDNDPAPGGAIVRPDANGQAAILLVESLIHSLIARSVLTVRDAIDIIEVASDVTAEVADEADDPDRRAQSPVAILEGIAASLSLDLPDA